MRILESKASIFSCARNAEQNSMNVMVDFEMWIADGLAG